MFDFLDNSGDKEKKKEKGSFSDRFGDVSSRFSNAWDKASDAKDLKLSKRVIIFVSEFFHDAKGLSDKEQKIDDKECKEIAKLVKNADAETLAKTAKEQAFGKEYEKLPEDERKAVDTFYGVGAESFKDDLDDDEEVEVARTIDVLTGKESSDKDFINHERRLLLAYYGFKSMKKLKLHFQTEGMGIDQITDQFDLFQKAIKKGKISGSNFSALYDLNFNPFDTKGSVLGLLAALPTKGKEFALGLTTVDWDDKTEVIPVMKKLLPATKSNSKAIDRIATIVTKAKSSKSRPSNREMAEMFYFIEVSDFDHLSKLVHK